MRSLSKLGPLWACLLAACTAADFAVQENGEPLEVVDSWEEGCEDELLSVQRLELDEVEPQELPVR
jgi:hypothetical protein